MCGRHVAHTPGARWRGKIPNVSWGSSRRSLPGPSTRPGAGNGAPARSEADAARRRLRVLAHPLRLRLLSLLTGAALSATEVAHEVGIAHAAASYHLHLLHDAGLIERVAEPPPARGHVQRRYRHDPSQPIRLGQAAADEAFVAAQLAEVRRRLLLPVADRQMADADVWLEPAMWQEACALADRLAWLVHAAARPPRTPGTRHVSLTTILLTFADDARGQIDVSETE